MSAISLVPGKIAEVAWLPKNLMAGITTSQAKAPPEIKTPAIFGPMMYPTPRYSEVVLARMEDPGNHEGVCVGVLGHRENMFSFWKSVYSAPSPSPAKTRLANDPPLSPAINTSAQAVPSG